MPKLVSKGWFAATLLALLPAGCTSTSGTGDPAMRGLDRVSSSHTLRAAYINYPPSMTVDPNSKAIGGIMPEVISRSC